MAQAGAPSTPARASPTTSTHIVAEGKLIVVGDSFCGKTSLVASFAHGEASAAPRPSIGCAYSKKSVTVPGCTVNFSLWDTAGQEKFRSVNRLYFRGAGAAVIVFDLTSRASFDHVPSWVDEIRAHTTPGMILALAGNKADLKAARVVSPEDGKALADRLGALYAETSARTGSGVADLFKAVAREVPKMVAHQAASVASSTSAGAAATAEAVPIGTAGKPGASEGFRIISVDRDAKDWNPGSAAAGAGRSGCC